MVEKHDDGEEEEERRGVSMSVLRIRTVRELRWETPVGVVGWGRGEGRRRF